MKQAPLPRAACFFVAILCNAASVFGLTVTQTKLGNIFVTGEQPAFTLGGTGASVGWTAKNYFGQTVASGTIALTGGVANLQPAVTQPGYYELNLVENGGGGTTFATTFAVIAPATLTDSSPFGVQTHFAQFNTTDLMDVIARGNIRHFRDEQYWSLIETTPGVYSFPSSLTGYMSTAATKGLKPLITADWSNSLYDWEYGDFTAPHTDTGRLKYANYALAVLDHYAGQIPALEVWNEYNGGTFAKGDSAFNANKPSYYYQMLKKLYEVVKPTHPEVQVVAGATVPITHGFLKGVFQAGGMGYLDVVSVHPYRSTPEGVELELNDLNDLIKSYNGGQSKPIWATEFSKNITTAADRFSGAPFLVQQAVMMRNAGVARMYYYLTQEDSSFPYRGLVRKNNAPEGKYVPNPSYAAYANLALQLHDWTPAARVTAGLKTTTYAYRFTKSGTTKHVLWATSPATVELSTTQNLTKVDIMGVSSTLAPSNGKVTLALTGDPCYVTGTITAFQDVNNPILADSASDYDKTQGSNGWSYGYATLGSSDPYLASNFQPLSWAIWKMDNYRWKKTSADYPFATVDTMHPGGSDWMIKRWTSTAAGKIHVTGSAAVGSISTDGVALRIFVDSIQVDTEILHPGDAIAFDLPEVNVVAGSKVDFAIVNMADTTNDATTFFVRITQVPAPPTLATPTNLTAQGVADNRVWLFWDDNASGETGYQIEWKWGTNNFVTVATTGSNATSYFLNTNMASGISYTYRVRAVSGSIVSAYSNTASTTDAPGGSYTQYALTVNGGSGGGNYNPTTIVPIKAAAPPAGQVFAGWTGNTSALANPAAANTTVTMPASAMAVTATYTTASGPPAAPSNLTAHGVADNRIQLNWSDNSSGEDGFEIQWMWGTEPYTPVATVGSNTTAYLHATNMATGRVYTYRIRSFTGTQYSAWSNTVSTTDAP